MNRHSKNKLLVLSESVNANQSYQTNEIYGKRIGFSYKVNTNLTNSSCIMTESIGANQINNFEWIAIDKSNQIV